MGDITSNGTAHSEATASGDLRSKRSWSKGNPECALDITFQRKNLPSLFNALLTQSLSTMSALKTLALRMQMSSGTKFSAISDLSTPRSAPNITNTSKKSRANETKTSSKTNKPNTGLRTLRCKILEL